MNKLDYDFVIIGSGFGGAVSALRLAQKGYDVLVIEKGKEYGADDFARTNWHFSRWLWFPLFRWFGIMKISFFRHVGILSGTGVGGGSLVYANVLKVPKQTFFTTGSWAKLADWQSELKPFYHTALRMLGAAVNPKLFDSDISLQQLAHKIDRHKFFEPAKVAVYFGEQGKTIADPFFGGKGPDRTGCIFCGSCMTGCRHNAKNSLDMNYLYLARQYGAEILAGHEVCDVVPLDGGSGSGGYEVRYKPSTRVFKKGKSITTKGVVFSGGVLGTVDLLMKLRKSSLPRLSERIGVDVRTNNESLISITSFDKEKNLSRGVAIGSVLQADENTHLELCRYGEGSGAWRWTLLPLPEGNTFFSRAVWLIRDFFKRPGDYLKIILVKDWARSSVILLFMQCLNTTLRFTHNRRGKLVTSVTGQDRPEAFSSEAHAFARSLEKILRGRAMVFGLMPFLNAPVTAHILGGAVMGSTSSDGVVDKNSRVFGYENMFVCDGSVISSNPGVNPALSITAIAERAMSKVPEKGS